MSKQPSEKALDKSAKVLTGVCWSLALVLFVASNFLDLGVVWAALGIALAVFGGAFLLLGKEYAQSYLIRQQMKADEKIPYYTMQDKDFVKDERGIVWVWIVAILTWAIMAVAYFALAGIVYMVLDQVEAMPYSYPQSFLDNLTLTRDVTSYFLIIMTIGILGWALISSVRKVDDTMPAY